MAVVFAFVMASSTDVIHGIDRSSAAVAIDVSYGDAGLTDL
ncbi:MAG TPA: hypothetical protein VN860_03990 [Candidatus Acidoferrales bacterium]|nr:hypothetical protein [Candidatus Acidoferrales bacterium]